MDLKELIKVNQDKIALTIGFLLVATLAFGLGRITAFKNSAPEIRVEEVFAAPLNNSENQGQVQSASVDNCQGKIKGNVSSTAKIYHMPGGSFYTRTNAEICFNTEAEAKTAGFRKSSR